MTWSIQQGKDERLKDRQLHHVLLLVHSRNHEDMFIDPVCNGEKPVLHRDRFSYFIHAAQRQISCKMRPI